MIIIFIIIIIIIIMLIAKHYNDHEWDDINKVRGRNLR